MIDIQYLLILQNLREMTGGFFDEIFNGLSKLSVDVLYFLPFIVYWSVDKKWGKRFIATMIGSEFVNSLLKLTVCAYRPWIRSDLIQPAGDSKTAATGYSFPSGHTNRAAAVLGTAAVWQYKKRRWLAILCAVGILLVGFSRNFLGVHTPQDVLVGCTVGLTVVFLVGKFINAIEGKDKLADILSVAGAILVVLAIVYVKLKPYPMDYIDGKLIVDPNKMLPDSFKSFGTVTAFLLSLWLDRHFIHYKIPVGHKNLPILTALGSGICFSWKQYFASPIIIAIFGKQAGSFIAYFIGIFFALVIFPIMITKFTRDEPQRA